jgi:hypothetical protein
MAQRRLCASLKTKLLLTIILFLEPITSLPASAEVPSLQQLYINPKNQTLPEALIIYNSANPCENCSKAINMLIQILKQNYSHRLHAYLINLQDEPQFSYAFHINSPISLVLIHISDKASFGYQNLTDLESYTSTPQIFFRNINEFINNFLEKN